MSNFCAGGSAFHAFRIRQIPRLAAWAIAIAAAACAQSALASESGASVYLLGSGGPGTAIMPPLQGVFLNTTGYYYDGSAGASKDFVVGGKVVAGLHAKIAADFTTLLWVPSTNFLGGTVDIGGVLPIGDPDVDVSAVITGPGGRPISLSAHDSAFIVGDPLLTGALGWKIGDMHLQLATLVNIPIGEYRDGQLSNLAFHRWAEDESAAFSWHDPKVGWDISGKAGVTFNGANNVTHYTTGTEFHLEGSIEKQLTPKWTLGAQSYFFRQLTGDSGSGAKLGPFEGEVSAVGGTSSYAFKIGKMPATLRVSGFSEFDVMNRMQGYSLWLGLTVPLALKMPTAPHPQ